MNIIILYLMGLVVREWVSVYFCSALQYAMRPMCEQQICDVIKCTKEQVASFKGVPCKLLVGLPLGLKQWNRKLFEP